MTQSEHSEIQHDVMDPARAAALQAALGLEVTVAEGTPLPPFFHQLYFWSPQPPHRLGRDGHPRVGEGMIPDMGLPRRMWAGGRLQFHAPLLAGVPAERRSFVDSTETKMGRSGRLGFVILRHAIWQAGAVRVTEWQDLVYREDALGTAPEPPVARTDETDSRQVEFSTTLLFRYSALTFNGHRIHYDADYAKDVEGYGGLVVHGPLLAQHLMLFATELMGPLTQFLFRASSPLMHFQSATLCRNGDEFWVRGPDGRQCMLAIAQSE